MSSPEDEATTQGNLLRDEGDFDKAITDYTEAIRFDPKEAATHYYNRGLAYGKTGDHDKAIADFTEAIRLNSNDAEAYYGRGCEYGEKGDHDKAIADFTEAIRLNPKLRQAFSARAQVYFDKREFDKAIADFTEATKLDPQQAEVYYWRACSYKKIGAYDKAIADFVQARKLGNKAKPDRPAEWHTANESRRLLAIVWASPYTLLGLFLGGIGLCTGGRARVRGGVVEFYGGGVKWLLQRFPTGQFPLACTMGHTILGQTDASLDIARDHEMVHVRQFERWGPLMGPAYLGCCLVLWLMRRRPYRDNPFEREAYGESD
jgi:Flp pilus assembly protein TadD